MDGCITFPGHVHTGKRIEIQLLCPNPVHILETASYSNGVNEIAQLGTGNVAQNQGRQSLTEKKLWNNLCSGTKPQSWLTRVGQTQAINNMQYRSQE